MPQHDLNLRDYWRILKKRWWSVAAVTVAFGVFALLAAEIQKPDPVYQATAVVKFERTTTLVGLLVETISLSQGDSLATQAAVVRSFPVLERAAKTLQLIPPTLGSDAIKQNPQYVQALANLRNQVAASPEENTTLIDITITSREAGEAARIANAVAQAYQLENTAQRNRKILEARRFIEEQLREVDGRLRQAEDGIRALKEERRFVSLTEETAASVARLTVLENEHEKVRREQADLSGQVEAAQNPQLLVGAIPARMLTEAGDPAIAKLNNALIDLTMERENLLVTMTPQHPQIKDLDARIATARGNLDARLRATRDAILRELGVKTQALEARAAELQQQIQRIREEQRGFPELARQHAQLQREITLNESLQSTLRSKLQEVQIKEREQMEEVSLVRPATAPATPTNPSQPLAKTIVGLLIGLTVGVVLAFVLESLDTSIGTIQDVESYLEVPVLGLIPLIDPLKDPLLSPPQDEDASSPLGRMRPFLATLLSPRSTVAEAYRSLRTNVEFLSLEKSAKAICITSASLMEGKTTTAINLAVSIAQMGKKTLLIEADLRKPFLHHAFGIPRDPGLTEVIIGNKDWRDCLRTATDLMLGPLGVDTLMNTPNIDNLHLLTSGTPPPNPAEFLNSQRMNELIASFREEFDVVIFDCPPILPVTDAAVLASKTDGTLIVYRVGKIARSALKRAKVLLETVRGRVLGVILTGLKAEISPDYEELQYYRYAYGEEPGRANKMQDHSTKRSLGDKIRGWFS
jgi:capsular exopolysaccharide synthesis family protein